MLINLLRVQMEGEMMNHLSRYREEAIQAIKDSLGEKYLLHPSNFVQRKDEPLSFNDIKE